MFKDRTLGLQILLVLVSVSSLVNIIIFKEHFILLPFASFSVIKQVVNWYIYESILDLILSILICLLLLAAAIAIRKKKIVIPALALVYLFLDVFNTLGNLGLAPQAWIPILFFIALTSWMGHYCIAYKKGELKEENTQAKD